MALYNHWSTFHAQELSDMCGIRLHATHCDFIGLFADECVIACICLFFFLTFMLSFDVINNNNNYYYGGPVPVPSVIYAHACTHHGNLPRKHLRSTRTV